MMTVYPNYYPDFACIAEKCRHNCCIGWEIDIDEDTLAYYDALDGEMGERLKKSILKDHQCASFKLDVNERCPFLREDNLCEIILTLGEDALCDICTDHPRFRHFFADRIELGVGLSCESAASLILSFKEKFCLLFEGVEKNIDPQMQDFYQRRESLLKIATQREVPLSFRMQSLLTKAECVSPFHSHEEWADFYRSLERMDKSFDSVIARISSLTNALEESDEGEILFEQLLVYFLYRHYTPKNGNAAIAFAVHATRLLRALCEQDKLSFEETVELCRLYSSEIEYSEENTDALLSLFENE